MPFGLTNSPMAFQQYMKNILGDLLDHCVVVYLDDILVYSDDPVQHREHIWEILKWLCQNGLFTKANKCKWHKDSVEFLGYILKTEGLTLAEDKVKIIREWPEPRKVKDVQSFLSFTNFYHRFIYNYSDIAVPLTCLTCKGIPWVFSDDCCKSFENLKNSFTTAPILMHWEPDWPLVVETDTLDYALAAIISMQTLEGELHPITFHSRTFTGAKLNYDVYNKELMAIFEAFKYWRHYLKGSASPIDVVTNHKKLWYFCTMKLLTWR